MQSQKALIAFTIAICLFAAISTYLSLVLTQSEPLRSVLLTSGLFLLPCAVALWLSRHLQSPFTGE